jgi:diguanylate cyclase (GGDEF)-like protein/PAS domain S-box-containing protein
MEWHKLENKDAEFFRSILTYSSSPMVITDALAPDNPIIFVNAAFEKGTGYTASEIIGLNCRLLQASDRSQEARTVIVAAIEKGEPCEVTLRNYRKDGSMFRNQLYLFPVRNNENRITNFVGIQHDVTAAWSTQAALLEKQLAIDNSIDVYIKLKRDTSILEANNAVSQVFGWSPEELIGRSAYCLVHSDRHDDFTRNLLTQFTHPKSKAITGEYRRKDGTTIIVEWTVSAGGNNDSIVCFGRDVTEKHRVEQEAQRANERVHAILDSITEGCFSVDRKWRCTHINAQGAKWLGRKAEDLLGKNIWDEFPETIGGPFYQTYYRAMEQNTFAQCEAYYSPLDAWFEARAYPYSEGLSVFFIDISARKRDEVRLIYAATHDSLTGLLNRRSSLKELQERLERTRLGHNVLALLFIDLDRFKEINDAFGHHIGDQILVSLAQRLAFMSDENRVPARISGDEFIFILQNVAPPDAKAFAEQLINAIAAPLQADGIEVTVSASIGIAIAGNTAITADELINQADTAMYVAKDAGRHTAKLFSPAIDIWSKRRLQLRHEIPHAIHSGQFVLHYQPQIRLSNNEVVGAEALVRWRHPAFGLLGPNVFLDIVEESSLILELGMWIFEEACRQLAEWERMGHRLEISINLSARQLGDPSLPLAVETMTRHYGIDPHCIKFEVTESMLVR